MLEKMLALQNKRKKEGGFTLVELIVVLVILAILAALLIPALTGYIDKAKEKSITAECRQAVMAAQTLADEKYATNTKTAIAFDSATTKSTDATKVSQGDIKELGEVSGTVSDVTFNKGKVTTLTYTNGGKKCVYTANPTGNTEKYAPSDAD